MRGREGEQTKQKLLLYVLVHDVKIITRERHLDALICNAFYTFMRQINVITKNENKNPIKCY